MIICRTNTVFQSILKKFRANNEMIGFVPTMGALHEGHISLIEESKQNCSLTICSIFVNPTQFNDVSDFNKYPITIENDIVKLEKTGCDILFLPSVSEIYPSGSTLEKKYDLGFLETILEGRFRKGHFQGVCQVVERLLRIIEPDLLFLGQKDYQQCMILTKLIELMNWQNKLQIKICPTLREKSGLAMSSRNMRLTNQQKENATEIFKTLNYIKENLSNYKIEEIIESANLNLVKAGFEKIDYVAICNAKTLEKVETYDGKIKLVALIAAFIGEVRLIDNLLLN